MTKHRAQNLYSGAVSLMIIDYYTTKRGVAPTSAAASRIYRNVDVGCLRRAHSALAECRGARTT